MLSNDTRLISLRRDPLLVILDSTTEVLHSAVVADPQTGANRLQHSDVVTDHQNTTLELLESKGKSIHSLDIQVVRRLVEDQDVRVLQTEAGESHTRFLTSGKQAEFLKTGHARDAESTQVATVVFVRLAWVVGGHEADCAVVHIESVDVVLGEEADAETWVLRDETACGRELADEQLKRGSLASSVGSYNTNTRV